MKSLTPGARILILVAAAGMATGLVRAQEPDAAAAMLEAAIQRQWVSGDLPGAIRQYEAILATYGSRRKVAAQALWRLGQTQEQLGWLDEARETYQRLVRQHPDEGALAAAAETRLEGLAAPEVPDDSDIGRARLVSETWRPDPVPSNGNNSGGAGGAGQLVVFSDLAVYNPRTGSVERLATGARSAVYPVLSNNGRSVAYLSWNGDLTDGVMRRSSPLGSDAPPELRVVGTNGVGDRLVMREKNVRWLRPFGWSPDNIQVLTLIERTSGLRQLALVDVESGEARIVKAQPELLAQDMSLSPDGAFLAYQAPSRVPGGFEFFVLPVSEGAGRVAERRYVVPAGPSGHSPQSQRELVVHVLNRIAFGPRPGDIDRVQAMGVEAYIEAQLHPERLDDPAVDSRIAGFTSLRMEIPELLEKTGPPVAIAERRRATVFQRPAVAARAAAAADAPGAALAARTRTGPVVSRDPDRPLDLEAHTARVIRAVHSERQLFELVVDFWMNHFNVNLADDQLTPSFEEQAIRQHAFGRFEDLLMAVSRHPKMLAYLDNWISSAPTEDMEARLNEAEAAADFDGRVAILEHRAVLGESKGLNENFARELLELHTMGVDSGYTQTDIIEVAKILTGWTVRAEGIANAREQDGVFAFDPVMHVGGDKVVLGETIPAGGVDEGERLISMLAHRPETARFIATKLARRFIADVPPAAVVDAASRTFLRTGGDIREVLRTILMSPEFRSAGAIQAKIKKPFELVVSALRAADATFEDLQAYADLITTNRSYVSRMGEKMYNHEAPDGNPDVGQAWMNSNALLLRLEFANALVANRIRGVTANLEAAETVLAQMGVARPSPEQIEQHRAMLAAAVAAATGPDMVDEAVMTMSMDAGAAGAAAIQTVDARTLAVAVMLGSPGFQKR